MIPLANIDRVKVKVLKIGSELKFKLYCKNFVVVTIQVAGPISFDQTLLNYLTDEKYNFPLQKLSFVEMHDFLINIFRKNKQNTIEETFAFSYTEVFKNDGKK